MAVFGISYGIYGENEGKSSFRAICRISVYGRKLEDFPKGNGTIPIKILSPGSILVEKIFTSQQKIFNQNKHGAFEQKKNQQHALLLFLK